MKQEFNKQPEEVNDKINIASTQLVIHITNYFQPHNSALHVDCLKIANHKNNNVHNSVRNVFYEVRDTYCN